MRRRSQGATRILFVASSADVQTAHWIRLVQREDFDIHLFDPNHGLIHPSLTGVTVHTGWRKQGVPSGARTRYRWPWIRGKHLMQRRFPGLWNKIVPASELMLARLIRTLRPDCVHSLGMQNYGYTVNAAKEILGSLRTPWLHTSKGHDIYYWQRFDDHRERIRKAISSCDSFICNCERDLGLANDCGFQGEFLGYFQGMGGYPVDRMRTMREPGKTSTRRVIAVKGLHHATGRALVALEGLERCREHLGGYRICFYQATRETREAVARLSPELAVEIVDRSPAEEIWRLFGRSRIALAVAISDGVPNAMIEAMIMGAFPVQTDAGGSLDGWIASGTNGSIVSPDDPDGIATALSVALADDDLVDSAAAANYRTTMERIDVAVTRPRIQDLYDHVTEASRDHGHH